MNAVDALFQRLRSAGRKAFIPFLTAGDPDVPGTIALARAAATRGASLLEIGFPYSDPIADGPVIQASYTRALDRGIHTDDILTCVREVIAHHPALATPLVMMVSYSIVHRRGPERFLAEAATAGFSGAIVPDLPIDESEGLARLATARGFKLIQLITPTTTSDRAARIARLST